MSSLIYLFAITRMLLNRSLESPNREGMEQHMLRSYLVFSERDDQKNSFGGVIKFVKDVHEGDFKFKK